jgi:hypothetical protein
MSARGYFLSDLSSSIFCGSAGLLVAADQVEQQVFNRSHSGQVRDTEVITAQATAVAPIQSLGDG